jgi:hypothetical protein
MKRRLVFVSIGIVLLIGVWLLAGHGVANSWEKRAVQLWTEAFLPLDTFASNFPAHGDNEIAQEARAIAGRFGLNVGEAGADATHVDSDARADLDTIKSPLHSYLESQLRSASGRVEPAPPEVSAYLEKYQEPISDLGALLQGHLPEWEQNLDLLYAAPIPPVFAIGQLRELLSVGALHLQEQGELDASSRTLNALWNLNQSLLSRPDQISQLVSFENLRVIFGTLRKLEVEPQDWKAKLDELTIQERFELSWETEAWMFYELARREKGRLFDSLETAHVLTAALIDPASLLRSIPASLAHPFVRFCVADNTERLFGLVNHYRSQDLCQVGQGTATEFEEVSWWNIFSMIVMPGIRNPWQNMARLSVDREMTQKVLEIQSLFADGAAPETVPGIESSVCSDSSWIYSVSAGGVMTLEMQNPPAFITEALTDETRLALPTVYQMASPR